MMSYSGYDTEAEWRRAESRYRRRQLAGEYRLLRSWVRRWQQEEREAARRGYASPPSDETIAYCREGVARQLHEIRQMEAGAAHPWHERYLRRLLAELPAPVGTVAEENARRQTAVLANPEEELPEWPHR